MEVLMPRTFMSMVLLLLGFPGIAGAHAGNNDPSLVHVCVGNVSKIVRSVGVGGTCIPSPPVLAETAGHWAVDATALLARLTTLETQLVALQGHLNIAVAALVATDTALQHNIDSESAARVAADTTLHQHIDGETNARGAGDTSLQNQVDTEAAARAAAATTLQHNIDGEEATRVAADTTLQHNIDDISVDSVPQSLLDLAPYVSLDLNRINELDGPHIIFSGANVHIQNGLGATNGNAGNPQSNNPDDIVTNGLGNLIVGYNEFLRNPWTDLYPQRTGSHNLMVGIYHGYPSVGAFLAGAYNQVSSPYTAVTGGQANTAQSHGSSVSGGFFNNADGVLASVSGGESNHALGDFSSVSGGRSNFANGVSASVSGGGGNIARNILASVTGGTDNLAEGVHSTVSGGSRNTASGNHATISGGEGNSASGFATTISGGLNQTATADYQHVP